MVVFETHQCCLTLCCGLLDGCAVFLVYSSRIDSTVESVAQIIVVIFIQTIIPGTGLSYQRVLKQHCLRSPFMRHPSGSILESAVANHVDGANADATIAILFRNLHVCQATGFNEPHLGTCQLCDLRYSTVTCIVHW